MLPLYTIFTLLLKLEVGEENRKSKDILSKQLTLGISGVHCRKPRQTSGPTFLSMPQNKINQSYMWRENMQREANFQGLSIYSWVIWFLIDLIAA